MKILDRYILTSYLKTFFSVFIILVLIFILQTIWLYIKELAGKDLDIVVIAKFLLYFLPKLMPLVLPLTILLASIMVFGSFAENYEFAAMKSTGISLRRAMTGLSIFIVLLGFLTFLFSNNVIPWAEYNSYNLRKNIAKIKPAMAIAEGQFNPIGDDGTTIKVEEKSGDRGQYLKDIVIHKKGDRGKKNTTTIIAKIGEIISSDSSNVLKLILHDGNYYKNILSKDYKQKIKHPFAKSSFKTYIINIDLSEFNNVDVDDKNYDNKYNMLSVSSLDYAIDSLTTKQSNSHETFSNKLYQTSNIYQRDYSKEENNNAPNQVKNLQKEENKTRYKLEKRIEKDSIYSGEVLTLFEDKNTQTVLNIINTSLSNINSAKQLVTRKKASLKPKKSHYNRHIISFHEKFALGFACVILFFVGAPLGALIRKGGLGLPMVIAILLFLTYHFIGIFAINSAKNGSFNPVLASWFSTLIMLPISIFLTKRATEDKALFDLDNITVPLKKIFNLGKKTDYSFLKTQNNEQLITTINNKLEDNHIKYEALLILNSRKLITKDLRENNLIAINKTFETKQTIVKNFKEHSAFLISLYSVAVILLVLFLVFKNNKLPALATASIKISIVSVVLYFIYYIKSLLNIKQFYTNNSKSPSILMLIIGFPLYFLGYFYSNSKINEDLKILFSKKLNLEDNHEINTVALKTLERDKNISSNNYSDALFSKNKLKLGIKTLNDLKAHSLFTVITYCVAVVLFILFFVFKNNKLPALATASIQLSIIAALLYLVYYIKSLLNIFNLYKAKILLKKPSALLLIIGLPLYAIVYVTIKNIITQGLKDSPK